MDKLAKVKYDKKQGKTMQIKTKWTNTTKKQISKQHGEITTKKEKWYASAGTWQVYIDSKSVGKNGGTEKQEEEIMALASINKL